MRPDNLAFVLGTLITAGLAYLGVRRVNKSNDAAAAATIRSVADSAESSAYTRGQDMVREAMEVQRNAFNETVTSLRADMLQMRGELAEVKAQLQTAQLQLRALQRARDLERRQYRQYVQKLLDLLHQRGVEYPPPPPFFDDADES